MEALLELWIFYTVDAGADEEIFELFGLIDFSEDVKGEEAKLEICKLGELT